MIKIINGLLSAGLAVCAACLAGRLSGRSDGRQGGLRAASGIRFFMLALYLDRISALIVEGIISGGGAMGGMNTDRAGESPLFFLIFPLSKGVLLGIFLAKRYLPGSERQPGGDTEEAKIFHLQVEGLLTGAAVFLLGMLFLERAEEYLKIFGEEEYLPFQKEISVRNVFFRYSGGAG